jgi:ATP-dependent exoDNAse (exonuclease V) beta subunit
MAERPVCDQSVRDRVTGDLSTTFLLEAGAGTGKTRVLVDRYVACVLAAGDVRAVAAITFTEKAAGELRQRIREDLERRAAGAAPGSAEGEAVKAALDALDDAPISTIHGFAGRLLREFPVEARVDPAFEQLDGLGSDLERARLWREWLTGLAADEPALERPRAWVARLLRAGVKLDDLRELAVGDRGVFGERYDVAPVTAVPDEPDLAAGVAGLAPSVAALADHCACACGDPGDGGCRGSMQLVDACRALLAAPPADADQTMAALCGVKLKATARGLGGRKDNWDEGQGGKDELWCRYEALASGVAALKDAYAEYITGLAVAAADAFSRWAGDVQLALGRLDFTDLLGCLRDLLAGDRAARLLLQRRFRYLLVDEFQDTDPLQAEIVFFLCEQRPLANDWRDVVLTPGKLFVVGDPKQSIYRFRRADIAMYDQVKALVAAQPGATGDVCAIGQNFRTTPAVLGWVNNVFADIFDDEQEVGRQPAYQWVEPYRAHAPGSRVSVLLGPPYDGTAGSADASRRDEARAVAGLLARLRGDAERWPVHEQDHSTGAERVRPPRWGDVAVLYRTTNGLETLEEALRAARVPYRVDGGTTYFQRREVDDVLLCLRAVDDPSDGPAIYGALHSTLFGFSDDDLFLYWAAGGRFDLFTAQAPQGHEAVTSALGVLRALHDSRADREPHEVLAGLLRATHAFEFLAATGPGASQAVANLHQLVERARAFAGAGGGGLGSFLAWAAEAGDAAGEQESQVDDDGDVVRLLTIHKAKGLEFPIVLVFGGSRGGGGGGGEPIVDRAERRVVARVRVALPGSAAQALEPPAYTALGERERRMSESELRRLLYVATTRARDHLVLSCFGSPTTKSGSPTSGALFGPIAAALPAPAMPAEDAEHDGVLVLAPTPAPPDAPAGDAADVGALLDERTAWRAERQALLRRAGRPAAATSPSGLEHLDDEVRSGGPGAPAGRAKALALGSAVHRIMELCDLADPASVRRVAPSVLAELGRPDLADDAAELAAACWASTPVRAAALAQATGPEAVFREVPIGAVIGDVVVNGAVDLLYRSAQGWVVVDYKTDREADAGTLLERYRPQGAAYAVAAEAVLGAGAVCEVAFVPARAGGVPVVVRVDDELRSLARREIAAAAGEGRALRGDELFA